MNLEETTGTISEEKRDIDTVVSENEGDLQAESNIDNTEVTTGEGEGEGEGDEVEMEKMEIDQDNQRDADYDGENDMQGKEEESADEIDEDEASEDDGNDEQQEGINEEELDSEDNDKESKEDAIKQEESDNQSKNTDSEVKEQENIHTAITDLEDKYSEADKLDTNDTKQESQMEIEKPEDDKETSKILEGEEKEKLPEMKEMEIEDKIDKVEQSVEKPEDERNVASFAEINNTQKDDNANKVKNEEPEVEIEDTPDVEDENIIDSEELKSIRQTHAIIMPSYSRWFNMKKIHKIEEDSLPEFFNGLHPSKSPKIYLNYRNFMINSYRLNPNEYLTLTSCRRNLVGNVGTLMRVHKFLNKWGLINYQVKPQFKPGYALEKLPNGNLVGLPYTGDYHVNYDTPRGLFPFDTSRPLPDKVNLEKIKSVLNIQQTPAGKENSIRDISSGEPPKKKHKDNWSKEELSKLIIGIKNHKNDWYKISKLVGNKSPQECIMKFLRLPIEDSYNYLSEGEFNLLKLAPNFPNSAVDNPVLSNLAFMTQIVDSDVAKAASLRASKVMDEKILNKIEEVYGTKRRSSSSEEKKGEEDEMTDLKEEGSGGSGNNDIKNSKTSEETNIDQTQDEDNGAIKNGSVELLDQIYDDFNEDISPAEALKDATAGVFGIVGARSHLFATYEEREMQKLSNTIINHQLSKIDMKLNKVKELENIYDRERKNLEKQQEEIFVDRIALTKSTINITKKLNDALNILQNSTESSSNEKISHAHSLLSEVKSLIINPSKYAMLSNAGNGSINGEVGSMGDKDESKSNESSENDNMKPLSIEAPQSFKLWVP